MTQQNLQILHELQRYAQRCFDAIHKAALTPGEYSAKQLIRDKRKMNISTAGYLCRCIVTTRSRKVSPHDNITPTLSKHKNKHSKLRLK